jgi:hypothetical protein
MTVYFVSIRTNDWPPRCGRSISNAHLPRRLRYSRATVCRSGRSYRSSFAILCYQSYYYSSLLAVPHLRSTKSDIYKKRNIKDVYVEIVPAQEGVPMAPAARPPISRFLNKYTTFLSKSKNLISKYSRHKYRTFIELGVPRYQQKPKNLGSLFLKLS